MIYMTGENRDTSKDVKIIVLESRNLEHMKGGQPLITPDQSVIVAWTPDPEWVRDRLQELPDGDIGGIGRVLEESAKRPQKEVPPMFAPTEHRFKRKDE